MPQAAPSSDAGAAPAGACDFPYMCVVSSGECTGFWEGRIMSNMNCADGAEPVCCDPFANEEEPEPPGGTMPPGPPSADPITRAEFCAKILECIMPPGSTSADCHDVYGDAYCTNWDHFLRCMSSCEVIQCSNDAEHTQFVLCEADCFDAYCG
jgi:hypothetical protein